MHRSKKVILDVFLFSTLCLLQFMVFPVYAQTIPDPPQVTVLNNTVQIPMNFNDYNVDRIAEVTPWQLENTTITGGDHLLFVSSLKTFLCSTSENIVTLTASRSLLSCVLRQASAIDSHTTTLDTTKPLWGRDFLGAFSGHMLNTNSGMMIYSINHGELVNSYFHTPCWQSPDIGYGQYPCSDKSLSYNAFVTMSSFNFSTDYFTNKLFTDLGPIVWPANGYVDGASKATYLGILHPSSIIKDGYIYVFFRDTSTGSESAGRGPGTKVARAPITANGIDPLSFKTYYQGAFSDNALPTGFNASNIMPFFNQKGGRSSAILGIEADPQYVSRTFHFSVAKILGTNYYLGVADDLLSGIQLRISSDLVHWSAPTTIPTLDITSLGGSIFNGSLVYTDLANSNGDSNLTIDPNDFYVIGTWIVNSTNHTVHTASRIHLKLAALPAPSITATGCFATPPGSLTVNEQTLSWTPGQGNLPQFVRISNFLSAVTNGCTAGDTGCVLYKADNLLPTTSSYTLTQATLLPNTTYYFRVAASDSASCMVDTILTYKTPLVPGDFDGDGHITIFDYNKVVGSFGNPYSIYDYNSVVANFGK